MGNIFISKNILLEDCPQFGNFNKDVVPCILKMVVSNFENWIGGSLLNERFCSIGYQNDNPETYLIEGQHHIRLNINGNYWCQWVYQFAHEYCHHLIDGPCNGLVVGLKWFEETLCELSSLHNLSEMAVLCFNSTIPNLNHYAPSVLSYLFHLENNRPSIGRFHKGLAEYISQHMEELSQDMYHRGIYSTIAFSMLPVFRQNPYLWKIVLHIGDSCQWTSLDCLLDHLQKTADMSYYYPLEELRMLLLDGTYSRG